MTQQSVSLVKVQETQPDQTMRFSGLGIAYIVNVVGFLWSTYVTMQMDNPLLLVMETLVFGIIIGMLIGRKRGNER